MPHVTAGFTRSGSLDLGSRGNGVIGGIAYVDPLQDVEGYVTTPRLSGTWSILDFSALSASSAARSGLHAAEMGHKSTRQEVALDARRKFYDVVKAIHLSRVSSQALRLSRDNERRVRALFDVGSVSRSDLLKAQVRTAQSELDSLQKHNAISVTRIILATAIGIAESQIGDVDTVLTAEPRAYDEAQVLAEAEAARPDLKSAKADWDAARASLRAANFLRLPYVSVTGSWTPQFAASRKTTFKESFTSVSNGVSVTVPAGYVNNSRTDIDRSYGGSIGLTWNIFTGFGTEGSIATNRA